ncbi:MAG: hypothetical protein AAFQ53_16685 [Bacteroidota bacterium]
MSSTSSTRSSWAQQIRQAVIELTILRGNAVAKVTDAFLEGRGLYPVGARPWRVVCFSTENTAQVLLNMTGPDSVPGGPQGCLLVFSHHKQLDTPSVFRPGAWEQWVMNTIERVHDEEETRSRTITIDPEQDEATSFLAVDDAALFDTAEEVLA